MTLHEVMQPFSSSAEERADEGGGICLRSAMILRPLLGLARSFLSFSIALDDTLGNLGDLGEGPVTAGRV